MPGVEYDGDDAAPRSRSQWLVLAGLAAVALLVFTRGVVSLLVLTLLAVLVGLVIGAGYAIVTSMRNRPGRGSVSTGVS
jgi:drug/metabolite transporter (DMT)-like permease